MKKTILFLIVSGTVFSQKMLNSQISNSTKIEILVNGDVQKINSEAIPIRSSSDVIEVRVYANQKNDFLIDSVKYEGCELSQEGSQVQEQRGSNTIKVKKYSISGFKKIVYAKTYYSMESGVYSINNCPGRYFYLYLIYNKKKSPLSSYSGFLSKYKFILLK
jgi:hypothetical protein